MSIEGRTYYQLQQGVLEHQFSESKYRPSVKRWLNDAQRRLVKESEIKTQESTDEIPTILSTVSYALPENFSRIIDLYNTETKELLTPLPLKTFDSLPTSEGRPYSYTVLDGNLQLYPTPNEVITLKLHYWKLPADMVEDTDKPEIPAQYQELLEYYALKRAFAREGDAQMAQYWEGQWEKGVLKARGEAVDETFDGPRQVPGTFGDEHGTPLSSVWWR